jgi:tRNA A-37 threonylcarbamoyl transferase component Bud32
MLRAHIHSRSLQLTWGARSQEAAAPVEYGAVRSARVGYAAARASAVADAVPSRVVQHTGFALDEWDARQLREHLLQEKVAPAAVDRLLDTVTSGADLRSFTASDVVGAQGLLTGLPRLHSELAWTRIRRLLVKARVATLASRRLGFLHESKLDVPVTVLPAAAVTLEQALGRGFYGSVSAGRLGEATVAVKTALPRPPGEPDREAHEDRAMVLFSLENVICSHLQRQPHANVTSYLGCIEAANGPPQLVFAFHYNGALDQYLQRHEAEALADPALLLRWMGDMAAGLASLHERRLVHYDVNLRNFLLSSAKRVLLSDFGLTRHETCPLFDDGFPPEMPAHLAGRAVDLFMLGRCFWLLLTPAATRSQRLAIERYREQLQDPSGSGRVMWGGAVPLAPSEVRAAAAEAAERFPPAQRDGVAALIEALVCDSPISATEACTRLQRIASAAR